MTQSCTDCKEILTELNGYKRSRRSGQFQSRCRKCFNMYCSARWRARKIKYINEMGNKCYDCQGTFHYSVYEFHHVEKDSKLYEWTKLRLRKTADIASELAKCILLCANCHRIRHCDEIHLSN